MLGFNSKSLTVTIFLLLLAGWVGFLGGTQYQKGRISITNGATQKSESVPASGVTTVKPSPLFRSQNATIQAMVVDFTDNRLTLKNDQGLQDSFVVTPTVQVFEFTDTQKPPTVSDIKSIKTDKEALVVLQLNNGEYQVISISYLPKTTPPPPPAASKP